jgi:hypothetical protein
MQSDVRRDAPASLTKEESIPGAVEKNLSFSAFSEAAMQRMGNKPAVVHYLNHRSCSVFYGAQFH